MGVGRRMKKQGPPEPLSEEHFARLKRKAAGLPAETSVAAAAPQKKKRKVDFKANGNASKKARNGVSSKGGKADQALKRAKLAKKPAKPTTPGISAGTNGKQNGKPRAQGAKRAKGAAAARPVLNDNEDEAEDEDNSGLDEFGQSELENGSEDENLDGATATLNDDFLESGSSVYDSDDDRATHAMFSEDEDGSDAEEKLTAANIEGLSRKLDRQLEDEAADAQAYLDETIMQTNIGGDVPRVLEDEDDGDDDDLNVKPKTLLAPDLQVLRTRITENIRVLDNFSKLAEEGRSRSEYTAQLIRDICSYYGYSEFLAEKLLNLFTPREAFAFFEANESARPVVIRTNTLRTHRRDLAQALIGRGVTLEPVGKWSKVGLQIFESSVPLGATPEYLAGHYILQAASSFLPCMALDPRENERVLDMAAAPGGKTTYLAAMMKNTGFILANDPSKARAKALVGNIHRLGARNVVVSNFDAREFPKPLGGFDRVLLDAPCSGTGVIAKDPSVKTNRVELDFVRLPHTQKQLLLAAIDSVNHHSSTGGYIVYSTCSVTVEENEQVIQYALRKRPNVRIVDSGLTFGKEGFASYRGKNFDPSMRLARRFYPHTYNMDGFFVVKLKKTGPSSLSNADGSRRDAENADDPDRTAIRDEDQNSKADDSDDDFGGFDEEEDAKYIEKARRNAMRRRGLNPKAGAKFKKKENEGSEGGEGGEGSAQ